MFLLTIIIWGIFEIYLPSIIFRPKNVAKVQQIFQLCKFFAKKIYQQFLKVIQNKIVNRSFTAFYNFYNVKKFSKIKNHIFTSVFHCVSLSSTSKNLKSPVNSYKNAHLFAYIKYFYYFCSVKSINVSKMVLMIHLVIPHYESLTDFLISFAIILVLVGIAYAVRRFIFDDSHFKEIIEAEKKRQAHPTIQNGIFTRLYTMPYDENLTAENIRAYCEEHFPAYFCSASDNWVSIRETKTGLSGEVRDLYITQLKDHNISAIDFKDPNEIEHNGRYRQSFTRSSLNDKGFSKDIREIVRHFQQEAIEQQTNR